MQNDDYLYHYATLDVLALILKNKQIKFRSIATMDDLQEDLGDNLSISRYVFASCWMNESVESIAMWKMYSDLKEERPGILGRSGFISLDTMQSMCLC